MVHKDHVALIRNGVPKDKSIWADFGSGDGAFTLALAELTDPQSEIFSIDKDQKRLLAQQELFQEMFPELNVHFIYADFLKPLSLPSFDGILMANSLHFIQQKKVFLETIRTRLKDTGRLLLVEYNVDEGNMWVPYPLSFDSFKKIAEEAGFHNPELLTTVPSRFLTEMYAAVAYK